MKTSTSHLIAAACVAGGLFALAWKSPAPATAVSTDHIWPDATQVDWIGTPFTNESVENEPEALPPVCLIRSLIQSKAAATDAARCLFNVPSPAGAPSPSPIGLFETDPEFQCILR